MEYLGEPTCAAANLVGGVQGCTYGCLGLGDCVSSCEFDAIHMINGLAVVDYLKCVGCGACARVCPRNIITMVPFKQDRMLTVACSNKDQGKDVRAVCRVGCIGCMGCARRSGLFTMEDNLARVDYDKYDPETLDAAGVAIDKCPAQGIVFVGIPTEEDRAKVEEEDVPKLVEADFKTTVDQTEWQG
jgi:ferredoxin